MNTLQLTDTELAQLQLAYESGKAYQYGSSHKASYLSLYTRLKCGELTPEQIKYWADKRNKY